MADAGKAPECAQVARMIVSITTMSCFLRMAEY